MSARHTHPQKVNPASSPWWQADLCRAAELAARLDRQVDGWLSGFDLPQPVIRILIALYQSPGCPQRVVGDEIGMSPPQISRNVKELIEQGIVTVDPSFSERQRVLRLTHQGEIQARELVVARRAAFSAAIDTVAAEDRPLVLGMARQNGAPGSERTEPEMRALTPRDAIQFYNRVLAALPTSLTHQPRFLAYASKTLATALDNWPAVMDSAGVALFDAEGQLVGACGIIAAGGSTSATLVGPFVEPHYRRAGSATQLLRKCLAICARLGVSSLTARVPTSDSNLASFLRTEAFQADRSPAIGPEFGTSAAWATLSREL